MVFARPEDVNPAMPKSPVTIVNVGYRSTNYWVISAGRSRVLVDLGWPGSMGTMRANLSRADIMRLGIAGEILHTPGHSDDSVSVLLDDGSVFTGDLTHPKGIGPEDPAVVRASWQLLKDRGAKQVYAGHGPVRPLSVLDD